MRHRPFLSHAIGLVLAGILSSGIIAGAQVGAAHTSLPGQAKESAFVYLVGPASATVAAGKPQDLELHFQVKEGLHINSHTPREKSLIATQLAVVEHPGLNVRNIDFPEGADYAFSFDPQHKLSVYTGEFILKAHIYAQPGTHEFSGLLRYQACDNASCYPPRTVEVTLPVTAR